MTANQQKEPLFGPDERAGVTLALAALFHAARLARSDGVGLLHSFQDAEEFVAEAERRYQT